MNVSQLIEILQTYSPDMRVIIDGYEVKISAMPFCDKLLSVSSRA